MNNAQVTMLKSSVCIVVSVCLFATSVSALAQSIKRRQSGTSSPVMISQLDAGFASNHRALLAALPIDYSQLPPELETIVGLQVNISKLGTLDSVFVPQMPKPPYNEIHVTVLEVARRRLRRFSSKMPFYKGREVDTYDYVDVCVCRDSVIRKMINTESDSLGRYVPGPATFIAFDSEPQVLNKDSVISAITFPDIIRDKGSKKAPSVAFRILVSPHGVPLFVIKVRSPSEELAELIRPHLKRLRFEPARRGGEALYFWQTIVVDYPSREADE